MNAKAPVTLALMSRNDENPTRSDQQGSEDGNASFSVRCPCCEATLRIDQRTGAVLDHATKQAEKPDFDALFDKLETDKQQAEDLFAQEQAALRDRHRLLDAKFNSAVEAVQESDTPSNESEDSNGPSERPLRPFDLD